MPHIDIRNVSKRYGATPVLHGIDLHFDDREFVVILGPSGCGKSTLLRMLAGLEEITEGEMSIAGRVVNDLEPRERDVAMVFQNYALYPHMTVYDNVSYSLRLAARTREAIADAVNAAAKSLGLTDLLARRPGQLSGGQRQRVALGRAIVRRPQVFLFDEPLSNLDATLRAQMRFELKRMHRQLEATSVLVTHDQVEAMTMASRIVVMNKGRVEQVGTPMEIYRRPATEFVASFVGSPSINLFDGTANSARGGIVLESGKVIPCALKPGQDGLLVRVGVRPEHLRLTSSDEAWLSGRMDLTEELGSTSLAHVQTLEGFMVLALDPQRVPAVDAPVHLVADLAHVHVFDAAGGQRLEDEAFIQ